MSLQLRLPAVCLFKDAASIAQQLDAALMTSKRTSKHLNEQAAEQSGDGQRQSFDVACADVTTMDSSLLAVLVDLKRRAQANRQILTLSDPPINLQRLAQLYGLDAILFGDLADVSQ